MKIKNIICIIIVVIFGLTLFNKCNHPNVPTEIIRNDTIYVTDTLYIDSLRIDTVYLSKYVVDTLKIKGDTVYEKVEIPIYTTIYKDSTYEAQISGYKAKLDYLKVYPRETIIYKEKLVKSPKKRFNWGIQTGVGYGLLNKKPDLYIGIGGQINF